MGPPLRPPETPPPWTSHALRLIGFGGHHGVATSTSQHCCAMLSAARSVLPVLSTLLDADGVQPARPRVSPRWVTPLWALIVA